MMRQVPLIQLTPLQRRKLEILGAGPVPQIQVQTVDLEATVRHPGASVHRQSVGYCSYATETGTHSAKLCRILETTQRSSWEGC